MIAQYNPLTHLYHCGDGTGPTHADALADAMMLGAFLRPVVCDAGPDYDDTPTDAPGGDDPETGPYSDDIARLAAHVADTYAALFPAAPPVAPVALSPVPAGDCTAASAVAPSCDVRGCESTRALRSVRLGGRYEVTLCAGHARAVRR